MKTSMDSASLTGAQRKYLRGLAHHLNPTVQIGKTGLTPAVLAAIDEALTHHELIKVRFLDFKDEKRELSQQIALETCSEIVGSIGHIVMFYRQHPEPEKRRIQLKAS